ncbi:GCN5-like N-acetyltransferase [Rhodopirellula maiorica SM1]|uniref:GCN5-like N-acetyltransferase n=1 Tax=Rhodopirellula maiorica SM1 TaxID=1265738 RepID=M5RZH7_9BACT|nr:GNAT family N-acetyltransferase [Rhodopirellula maiorica]EMI20782.1 GCN5-like N-acetyltransferase [Rhodopirellula maiorica SM1]
MARPLNIAFRSIAEDDLSFLYQVYASTRAEELSLVDWDDAQKEQFLQMQFAAQHKYYQENYSDTVFDVIEVNGEPAGRLYLQRRRDEHRVVDIALLPEYRGKGIGRKIMQDILDEAGAAGLPVRIHVEHNNPAMHLYQRLGFEKIDDTGVYFLMQRLPQPSSCPQEEANTCQSQSDA